MKPLRSRLSIPVIGPGQAMFHLACQLGQKFSILSMTDGTVAVASLYRKLLGEYELGHRCAFDTPGERRDGLGEPDDRQGSCGVPQARGRGA